MTSDVTVQASKACHSLLANHTSVGSVSVEPCVKGRVTVEEAEDLKTLLVLILRICLITELVR